MFCVIAKLFRNFFLEEKHILQKTHKHQDSALNTAIFNMPHALLYNTT